MIKKDQLLISKIKFQSRLIVGTGKYKNMEECAKAIKISGAEIVTVAVRRVNISDKSKPLLMDYIDPKKITYLPNTAGCFTSDEALRTLRLAREIGGWKLVKLEVLGIQNKINLKIIRNQTKLPVIVDAGIGEASDAAEAMELGCDAVLVNTAIAKAKKPMEMAEAMKYAVIAGRKSYLAGRIERNILGSRSTTIKGLI